MEIVHIISIITDVLQLDSRIQNLEANTRLLGGLPEFDSMAVVSIITAIEDSFGIIFEDDEVTAEVFETVGSLHKFVLQKLD